MDLNEDDDFGFSAVSEEELKKYENELKAAVDETTTTAVQLEDRLAKLYAAAIIPLLNNLEKNPDKEYILWPGRDKKIKQFKTKLKNIYEGKS
jgi:hypothetical protein